MQRVDGEERRDERAPPGGAGHGGEDQEQERRVRRVQRRVDEVVRARVEPEELDVEHMREPGDRVPVGHLQRRERPADPSPGQATPHHGVVGHVPVVVEEEEVVTGHLGVEQQRAQEERGSDAPPGVPGLQREGRPEVTIGLYRSWPCGRRAC